MNDLALEKAEVEKEEVQLAPLEGRTAWSMATGGALGLFATFVSASTYCRQQSYADSLAQGFTNGS